MRFITDYQRIIQKLVRNTYPLPRIGETINHMEGFQYETTLYFNMVYYTISISPSSQDMTAIVVEFGKFSYNRLPMCMCAKGDILLVNLDQPLGDIEGVKIYIDDILALRKYCFRNHIEKLIMIFGRLRAAGLKVNAPKCIIGLKEIT